MFLELTDLMRFQNYSCHMYNILVIREHTTLLFYFFYFLPNCG